MQRNLCPLRISSEACGGRYGHKGKRRGKSATASAAAATVVFVLNLKFKFYFKLIYLDVLCYSIKDDRPSQTDH
jgi:hypothetical protein